MPLDLDVYDPEKKTLQFCGHPNMEAGSPDLNYY